MTTQNLKRKKINTHLADRKKTGPSKASTINNHLSTKQMSKRPEEALSKAHRELEIRVRERTTELMSVIDVLQDEMVERKRAEAELRESERKYRELADFLPEMVYEADENGKIVFANRCAFETFGYTQEDFDKGLSIFQMIIPEHREEVKANFQMLQKGKKIAGNKYTALRKDGSTYPVIASTSLIIRDNKPIGVRGVVVDITDHKQAEEALRQESLFRNAIIEHATEGLCVCHEIVEFPHVAFTVWNDRMIEITGYTMNEINRLGWYQTMYPDPEVQARAIERMARMRQGDDIVGEDWEITRADGEKRMLSISTSILQTDDSIAHVLALMQDITERKQKGEEIRHTLSLLNATLESTADGILVVDRVGKIESFNQKFVQMWRIPKSIIASHDDDQALTFVLDQLKDPEGFLAKVRKLYSQQEAESFDFIEFKDGRVFERYSQPQRIGEQSVGRVWSFRDVTERKKTEEALRTEKQRFQTLSEQAPFGMVMIDQDGTFKYINHKFREIFGYDLTDVPTGKRWFRKAYPDPTYRHQIISDWVNDLESSKPGEKRSRVFTAICKDGTEKIVNFISVQLERGEHLMACEDITERKQAEENLKDSEEKYKLLVEESLQGIVVAQGFPPRLVFANPAMTMILGYTFEEFLSLSPKEIESLVHPDDRAFFFKNYKDRLEGKLAPPRYEIRAIRKDGTVVWLDLSSTRIEYKGHPAVQAAFLDITDRKRTGEALRESEERYRTILENIEDGYYEVDLAGNFTFFNDSLCRMLGYSRDEMIGMGNQQYTDQGNRKKLFQAFNEVYRTGVPAKEFDWEVIRKDGMKLFGEVSVSLIKDSKGKPIGFRGIARDITKRKQAEEALRNEKQRFQTLSDQAPFGMVMIDQDGTFKYMNPKFRELFGYDLRDIPDGKTWFRKAYPNPTYRHDVIEVWINDLKSSKPGGKRSRIFTVTCKDGTEKTINFIPVQLETGEKLMACEDITERKRAEEALGNSEERFRIAAKSSSDLIWDWDILGGSLEWFGNIDERLGYNPGEFPRTIEAWEKIIHPDEHDRVMKALDQHLKIHKPYMEEYRVQRKDGTFCYWTDRGTAFWDEKGNPFKMIGACEDITERKRSEESLEKSEMRFMELFNDAPVGYFEYNVEGFINNVNRTYLEMLGYKFEEMIGQPVWKFIVEEEVARQQILEKLVGTMPPGRGVERTYRRKDGTRLSVLIEDRILRDSEGRIKGIRTTIHDITERKHAEEALRESEAKYRQLVEYAPSGIFEIDLNTLKFLNVNDVMCEVMGYSKEEFLSMSPFELLTEEGRNFLAEGMEKMLSGEKIPDSAEVKLRTKDKSEFWALVNTKMFYKDGKPFKAQVVAQDISERKRLEEQLIQSQKMEAVGQLAGGIAHDFNNLLTVIKGYGQLSLLDLKESDPLWGNIQEIQKATQRASDLTRQLLAFSRRQILDLKVLNLNSLVRNLNKMLRRIIGEDIELITLLNEDLGRVKVDPGQIEQMILNLAVNSRDAMPSGGKLIIETKNVEIDVEYVATHIGLTPGRYVRLSVSDTGVGMSQEIVEKAFEPFFTTKETGKGTGLGLSTVYGIVKQSGGGIQVYSEPGFGTTFNIYLPRVEENLDALDLREESDFLPKGSETVLLVEDESSVRNLAYRILCQQGYTVLEAANGDEALRIVQERNGKEIDLLLTDVVMPRMSGKDLADRLKTLKPELKVLFTSGYTDDAIVHHGVLNPGTHFLQKPFSPKALSLKVREVLDW